MKKKILIVDDEPEFVEMIRMRLEANAYEVVTAGNGVEGFEKATHEHPHLILLDVMMPGMDGFEVLARLRRHRVTREIPVVMLTARGESRAIFEGQDQGANDYLIKPCTSEDLLDVCRRLA